MSKVSDQYKTIEKPSEGIYKEKGSKFLAFAHPVQFEDEIRDLVQFYRKEFHDARHHCYAWELGVSGQNYRTNDDGEPSGTAGKPILGQIHSFGLTNVFVMVVRYFGGTKLGVSGLIQAYKESTCDALKNAVIIEKTVDDYFQLSFNYLVMNDIMKLFKEVEARILKQDFQLECIIEFCVRQNDRYKFEEKLKKVESVRLDYIKSI